MKYFVNGIDADFDGLNDIYKFIGLFTECQIEESDLFLGHYTTTKFKNVRLVAVSKYTSGCYLSEEKRRKPKVVNNIYKEIKVDPKSWIRIIDANTDEEAVASFKQHKWREMSKRETIEYGIIEGSLDNEFNENEETSVEVAEI